MMASLGAAGYVAILLTHVALLQKVRKSILTARKVRVRAEPLYVVNRTTPSGEPAAVTPMSNALPPPLIYMGLRLVEAS